jgi:hypothetical protein
MPEPIDLGKLGNLSAPKPLVDKTSLPRPTRATVTLTSGLQFEAVPIYGGMHNGRRRYKIVAESDWATMRIASIGVDRWPADVSLHLKVPDEWTDEQCSEFGYGIRWFESGDEYRTAMRIDR